MTHVWRMEYISGASCRTKDRVNPEPFFPRL
jgi:hypothetical protein